MHILIELVANIEEIDLTTEVPDCDIEHHAILLVLDLFLVGVDPEGGLVAAWELTVQVLLGKCCLPR